MRGIVDGREIEVRQVSNQFVAVRLLCAVLLVASLGALACLGDEAAGEVHRYTVAGELVEVVEGTPTRLRIEHERIGDFIGVDGELEPMEAMTMTMVVAEGVALPSGLAAGDPVEFVLEVDWLRSPAGLIRSIVRLDRPPEGSER